MTAIPSASSFGADYRYALAAFLRGLRPAAKVSPADWGANHFVVPLGERAGELLDLSLTPYICEPLEMLAPDTPWTEIAVRKSAQTGFSTLGLVWLFSLIDGPEADQMMYVLPTITAARDFHAERLAPAIAATKPIAARIRPQRSRISGAEGSTTLSKKFPGGRLILTGANSSVDLSSKTIRYAVADEVDRWPADLDGQGDPMAMLDARQIAYTRTGRHKKLTISTPTVRGASRIDKAYEAGDQRVWRMPCPHCATEIDYRFENLRYERHAPFGACYVAQCCGAIIESWRQRAMVVAGRWVPTRSGPGRQPSYFINALTSLLTSWDKLAEEFWRAQGDPAAEKAFRNLWLGESYEEHGQELDPARIVASAEDYPRNRVPDSVGRLVFAVDTQDDRFEWALWGFGPPPTSVTPEQVLIAAGAVTGDLATANPWAELAELGARRWPHAGGKALEADICLIDSGGHWTQSVYGFVRGKKKWRALKGASQRDAAIVGTPKRVEVKNAAGRLLYRVPLWLVNTHELKLWLSHALKALEQGRADFPGRLRLTRDIVDEAYIRQLTAEVLVPRERRDGRIVSEWQPLPHQANEALDLAVYARAFAYAPWPNGLGVDRIDRESWSAILADRHAPATGQATLFDGPLDRPVGGSGQTAASVPVHNPPTPPPRAPVDPNPQNRQPPRERGWIRRRSGG